MTDSIMLRWVPSTPAIWKLGMKSGYLIERYTMDQYLDLANEDPTGKGTLITASPVMPLPKEDSAWKKLFVVDEMNEFVYENIYPENSMKEKDPAKIKTEEQLNYGLTLKACDLSIGTAKAAGLFFTDKTISPGEKYIYRVRLASAPANLKHTPGIASAAEITLLHAPENIKAEFRNRKAVLSFDVSSTREECAGYIIERSDDSIHFLRVNKTLFIFAHSSFEQNKTVANYRDSFPSNNKMYWYRVCSYSYFGITGPPSATVHGKGRDDWNCFPLIDTIYSPDNKIVKMKWSLSGNVDPSTILSFEIYHSASANSGFRKMETLPASSFEFTDAAPSGTNYYEIAALSKNNDTSFSFPYLLQLIDSTPPPVPEMLNGKIDSNGVVHLSWKISEAPDLKGYRVFRCNALQEEFVEVNDSIIRSNFFTDTISLHTLTHNVYYCVRSVDMRWNNSNNSTPLQLKRPDKIPPVPVLVNYIFHTDTSVNVGWINSTSDDVSDYVLTRREENNEVKIIFRKNGNDSLAFFEDTSVVNDEEYSYRMTVTDSSGNKSVTDFPSIIFQPRIIPAMKMFSAVPDREKRKISLSWNSEQNTDRYIIYKAKKGEQLRTWKTVNGNITSMNDNELYPGNEYVYAIKAIMKSGAETKMVRVEVDY
ncbi:MAG: fibronectin type III domain-containing protein [Bacteroidetes bacterium]|nr:fibronectin type III domain-containing protein [Bacteroidota bacterium]